MTTDLSNLVAPVQQRPPARSLFVIGIVEYSDIFRKRHVTTFCYTNTPVLTDRKLTQTKAGTVVVFKGVVRQCNVMN
jgi:hypothetical protein